MPHPRFQTITEQVAAHLREEMLGGRWGDEMPGQKRLAARLGVSGQTVELALQALEKEGLLVGQGAGRCRRIVLPETAAPATLRVAILDHDQETRRDVYIREAVQSLEEGGHRAFFARSTLMGLQMDVQRVAELVDRTEADAWVVRAGSSDVLRWFAEQPLPAFALFGNFSNLPIAGVGLDSTQPALGTIARRLVNRGHRRVVLLISSQHRLPEPGRSVRAFLDTLEEAGVRTGPFNLPSWNDSKEGLQGILTSLFAHTQPTALVIDEIHFFIAVQQFLLRRGIRVPEDVSLVCTDSSPIFVWCEPSVANIVWDWSPMVRRIARWADNVARGKDDRRQSLTKAEFVEGGTVGPAPEGW